MNVAPAGLEPKRPRSWASWDDGGEIIRDGTRARVWRRGRLLVLSSVVFAEFHGESRWHWLVSASSGGWRATDGELERVRRDFGMEKAEEDNHAPGRSRALFLLCDAKPEDPAQCDCKTDETVVVEPDGYTWAKDASMTDEERERIRELSRIGTK